MAEHERKTDPALAHLAADGVPPDLRFEIGWTDVGSRAQIQQRMRQMGRQTMNLRLMPTARLMYLKAMTLCDGIVGWGGLDFEYNPEYPELFSLFVEPKYRTYTLGLLLELARYTFLRNRGLKIAYARMDLESNYSLLQYRLQNCIYQEVDVAQLAPEYLGLCQECELYRKECRTQGYYRIDIDHFLERGEGRIGPIAVETLPRTFELRPEIVRKTSRQTPPPKAPFKPHWL